MSPRTSEQNAALREKTEERILMAALRLFSRHGYAAASVRMIAKEAGISLGLMYNYFESKEVLLMTLFTQSMADIRSTYEYSGVPGHATRELQTLLDRTTILIPQNIAFWKLFYSLRMQPDVIEALGPAIEHSIQFNMEKLILIVQGIGLSEPEVQAAVLYASIDGICQHFVMNPETYPLQAAMEVLFKKYSGR
jgi:AcrR family transcriptional regulator